MLSQKEIWWRPHSTSNSVGNLVLHLDGNVRQWVISGMGGAPDRRQREKEFAERGPIPGGKLLAQLRATVGEACAVIAKLTPRELARKRPIQRFRVTGLEALVHVTEHFAFHTGQIVLLTKMKRRRDLGFTRLPGERRKRTRRTTLRAI
jgi:uncharacterized damage-inducible protein DinB